MLIVAVGNAMRGDDGVGPAVAELLAERDVPGARVVRVAGAGADLLEVWGAEEAVIVVDALCADEVPGTLWCCEARDVPLPAAFSAPSTHAYGVAEAIELGRALGRLPARLRVYGVVGADFALGASLSPAVAAALPALVARIVADAAQEVG